MRDKRPTRGRQGQLTGANSDAALKLARMLGIDGLRYLTDAECDLLIDLLTFLDARAKQEAFFEGWRQATEYNADMRLLALLPLTMKQH